MISDANQLAMVLAFGPDDGRTYGPAAWQDADGNLYAAASWEASPEWVTAAQSTLERPEWDTEDYIDMVAAERAQAVLVYSTEALLASPAALTAIGGMSGPDALAAMGLTMVETEDGLA
jgi:hypothetical protein